MSGVVLDVNGIVVDGSQGGQTFNGAVAVNGSLSATRLQVGEITSFGLDSSGTPGNATVSGYAGGIAAFAAGTNTLTLTNGNSSWTAGTRMFMTLASTDATAVLGAAIFVNSTTFTLNLKTACTGITKVYWQYFLG